jgi:two-component system, NtrC family, sensor kinase
MEILIAEDDYISRSLLKKMLVEMGHDVLEAENGMQAWQLLQEKTRQIVITDWMMPEMDGLELCRKIREASFGVYIYTIMLTAKDRKKDLVEVFESGADDYIPKPFDPQELRARVLTGMRVIKLENRYTTMANTLIESRNKLRIVLDSLKEEIVSLDKEMKIVSVNQSFVDRLGCPPDAVVGERCFDDQSKSNGALGHPDIEAMVAKLFKTGESQNVLLIENDPQGMQVYRQVSCLPIMDEHKEIFQVVLVSQDITENRRKAAEIQNLNDQLMETSSQIEAKNIKLENALMRLEDTQTQMLQSEKMASIGQLAAGVAHEINNPTGFVSSNLKSLKDYQKDIGVLIGKYKEMAAQLNSEDLMAHLPASFKDNLQEVLAFEKDIDIDFLLEDITDLIGDCREGTDRIKKIVMDLKDFAHPGEDKIQSIDINKGLDSTLNVVNNEVKYKATVHKTYGELPYVNGYPQQLNQVFMNILVNAAQAIDKKGEIYVTTDAIDGCVVISIADTGSGISKDNLTKIFDPFFTTKEVGKGTGLGMNIAYNIIKKHNGTIDVSSEIGKGTTFTIRIPIESEALESKALDT